MPLILGVDPGSLKTGFGVIDNHGSRNYYVTSGVIRLPGSSLPERLKIIFDSITRIIDEYHPAEAAVEQIFVSKSAGSALKLGQARGAAIVAAVHQALPVYEYEARKVKQSVVGTGAADKHQVQEMVRQLLRLPSVPQEDAADALAVALCHAHGRLAMLRVARVTNFRRGRMV